MPRDRAIQPTTEQRGALRRLHDAGLSHTQMFEEMARLGLAPAESRAPKDWVGRRLQAMGIRGGGQQGGQGGREMPESEPAQSSSPQRFPPSPVGIPMTAGGFPSVPVQPTPKDAEVVPGMVDGMPRPRFSIPESPAPRCDNWPRIKDDGTGYAIIGDIHSPAYDRDCLLKWMDWAYRLNIRKFIIIGDVSNQDPYSKFGRGMQQDQRLQEECIITGNLLKCFFQWFTEGHFIPGNHDIRIQKQMQAHFDSKWILPRLFDSDDRLAFHEHGQIEVESGDQTYRCIHGTAFSRANPCKPVQDYAEVFQANVIMGHQHLAIEGTSRCGRYRCVVLGGALDDARIGYKHFQPGTFPKGRRSFGFLRDGHLKVVYPDTPDWG